MHGRSAVALVFLGIIGTTLQARDLTFKERVEAQAAIERVSYAHQIGTTLPFEEAVPQAVLEHKVRTYLKQSDALATLWNAPIAAEDLSEELARMVRHSLMPDRLEEIFGALSYDNFLIEECLVRPVLVDRRLRELVQVGTVSESTRTTNDSRLSTCVADDTWDNGSLALLFDARQSHTAVWTGNRMIVWGGNHSGQLKTGWVYDPATDSAKPTSTIAAPSARDRHTAVWTGTRMVVWGGSNSFGVLGTGGQYEPLTDSWVPVTTVGAPAARALHTAVWTGSHMIVWGGASISPPALLASGGVYDPTTNSWTATSNAGAPTARSEHTAVWTGSQMVVWGGRAGVVTQTGGRYDPALHVWTATSTAGAPTARSSHTAIWTGSRMIAWGGLTASGAAQTGGRYDALANAWTATSTTGAPSARSAHSTVWTGSRMMVWGGATAAGTTETGGRYDPSADGWVATSTIGAPSARSAHSAVWTGSFMLVWGGGDPIVETGGRYALDQSSDDDGDGLSECAGDCSDADAAALAEPGEIANLHWVSSDTLAWDSDAVGSGLDTTYDVMYGSLADVANLGPGPQDHCAANDTTGLLLSDPSPLPPPGEGWFFLVRGNSVCGPGRYETATNGSDRNTRACEASDCCTPDYSVGCSDPDCQLFVCSVDSFCCEVAWDLICDGEALCICVPNCGDCCDNVPNSVAGCSDQTCQNIVCGLDRGCCDYAWTDGCADLALEHCAVCVSAPPPSLVFGGAHVRHPPAAGPWRHPGPTAHHD